MQLISLSVENYRGFHRLDLAFARDETVLVGVNGAGKTSILDGVALALSWLTTGIRGGKADGMALAPADIRIGAGSAAVRLVEELGGAIPSWTISASHAGHDVNQKQDVSALERPIRLARGTIEQGAPCLPLVLYFPTNRSALDIPSRISKPHEFDALSAYDGALERGSSNFRGFFEWFREEEDVLNERIVAKTSRNALSSNSSELDDIEDAPLIHVRRAIEGLFPGGEGLHIERRPQRMMITTRGVSVDVAQLSDGEKCLLAMAVDLARRMVLAAPTSPRPLEQDAVVLIDEIELHLHPGLQRSILPSLRKIFPNTQFIVSTHSPQVLSSVHVEQVRALEGFELRSLDRGT